jgi:type I restriction enzyme S subunit
MSDKTTTISATTKDTADRPKGWKMTTLGEVAEINPSESLKQGTVAKYVAMENLQPFTRHISKYETKEFTGGMKFRNGDTLLARITPCLENGKTAYVDVLNDNEVGFGSTEYIVFREKINLSDKKFLYYLSISPRFRELAIKAMTGTSGRQRVQTDQLINELLILPDLPEQRAIAAVLSSLDDKIELLHEQNKTLEATAQTIFKEWFVNFNFPGATGKMIDSELGEIPEGWEVKKFGDVFKIEYGRSDKKFDEDGEFPVYGAGGIVGYSNSNDYQGYQIIVGCRGTCGNITLAYEDSKITHNSLVVANEWFKPFSYLFLQTIDIKRAITGSTQPQITIGDLANIEIYVPEDLIIKLFSENIKSIFEKIKNNSSQIQTLSSLRDTLLPKLMKGEVRVKGFIE